MSKSCTASAGLFNDLWANQDLISVNHVVDLTLPVRCLIDHLIATFRFVPLSYSGLYRLHFSLLEAGAAGMHIQLPFFSILWLTRIWKKCFVGRGWHGYSSWPYDDLQRCSARRYQWSHFMADGSWLGVKPDCGKLSLGWRATCASPKLITFFGSSMRW
jgi:hypothetical protein